MNLLPLNRGDTATFRWRNNRHMKRWSTQKLTVSQVVNNSAQVDVKHVSGPIAVAASYVIATRLSGVALISGRGQGGDQGEVPEARARAARQSGRSAALLHAAGPDGLRLQPDPAGARDQGRDVAQRARGPRLGAVRRDRRRSKVVGDAERADQGGAVPDDGRAREAHAGRASRSAAARARATSPAGAGW